MTQRLPYRPLGAGSLNLIVALRTLLRDSDERSSFYDELLTVAAPMRLTCGLQVQF